MHITLIGVMVLKVIKNSLKKIVRENIFVKKNSMKKKTNLDKKYFPEIFQSLEIFQSS